MLKPEEIEKIIQTSVKESFEKSPIVAQMTQKIKEEKAANKEKAGISLMEQLKSPVKKVLSEALFLVPKTFLLKTEFLSSKTKQAHESLYRGYVDAFNKLSSMLDASNVEEASSNWSAYRSLKVDEQFNLNAIKLHELYFSNISDLASQIAVDSVPFMRLARDYGSFDRWQFDFRACAMSAREGWVVTYYEPYRNVYVNCVIDGHNTGIPLGGIPILVVDMWSHSYYRDYLEDKKSYINAMMREINWNVVEARMVVAERANMDAVFKIAPIVNSAPERILQNLTANNAPIEKDQISTSKLTGSPEESKIGT